jgi:hypothetical protein
MSIMKKLIFISLILLIPLLTVAQSWQWANCVHGYSPQYLYDISVDKDNNVYAAYFSFNDNIVFNDTSLAVNGFNDFFMVKYDEHGNEIWINQYGGSWYPSQIYPGFLYDVMRDLKYDSVSNCIYGFGNYVEYCDFGNGISLTGPYDVERMFLAKFDLDGNCLWALKAGSSRNDHPLFICFDDIGNIYFFGLFYNNGTVGTVPVSMGGNLVKVDPYGNVAWVKKLTGIYGDWQQGYYYTVNFYDAVFYMNALYLSGVHLQDDFVIDTIEFNSPGYNGQLLLKLDTFGNVKWLSEYGGPTRSEMCYNLALDDEGFIYTSGSYEGGYATFSNDTLFSNADKETYIVKSNPSGDIIWAKQTTSSQYSIPRVMCHGVDGIYLAGNFKEQIAYGDHIAISPAETNFFVLNIREDGVGLGLINAGVANLGSIVTDFEGMIYLGGFTTGELLLGDTTFIGGEWGDAFVAKHSKIADYSVIHEIHKDVILVFPNPSKGNFNIEIPNEIELNQQMVFRVFDSFGRLCFEQKLLSSHQNQIKADIINLPDGIYCGILVNEKKTYSFKIIIE